MNALEKLGYVRPTDEVKKIYVERANEGIGAAYKDKIEDFDIFHKIIKKDDNHKKYGLDMLLTIYIRNGFCYRTRICKHSISDYNLPFEIKTMNTHDAYAGFETEEIIALADYLKGESK